ncbi:putative LmbE-like protein [Belliella baltica DSM 15883]|uniref:Putative LmbE-like protein n=1 Tax=Belliella baltica (strain DSM 15883 / CIP 108006 / LMG 21964 / BA134) TaxID=866536 RepID=I3Z7I6_BELBD|nr:PIG-L family deacetylase [Belliella baltica]AFL85204.1 putative LmbE-like protein [Belliella baltica DSM 15883]
MLKQTSLLITLFGFLLLPAFAQNPSSKLYHDLLKLKETKRILFVAAHPDDENTRLISYLANGEHAQVAYLSLTRGDGGQNLIGKELGIELGMIRTHELLQARNTDGGRQFFTRALDFGFSKNPDETLNNWEKQKLLADVVWIIRDFQPDIIINRFNTTPGTTHGHHTTSAILASEAFEISGNKDAFSDQLNSAEPWQAKRLFWNAYNWGGQYEPNSEKNYHIFPVGDYNPLLGTTYSQIAADSRTMHKSQGFGSTSQIGVGNDFIEQLNGESFENSPFEGIQNRWEKIEDGLKIESAIQNALNLFDFVKPENNVKNLLTIKRLMDGVNNKEKWFLEKKSFINQLILSNLGVKSEFIIRKEIGYPGETLETEFLFNNPSALPITVKSANTSISDIQINKLATDNKPLNQVIKLSIPTDYPVSQPFWLEKPIDNSLFDVVDLQKIGQPINKASISSQVTLEIDGQTIQYEIPLMYKYNDQVDGEIKQPFTLVPEVNINLDKQHVFLVDGANPELNVEISFRDNFIDGVLTLEGLNKNQYQVLSMEKDDRRKRILYKIRILDSNQEKMSIVVNFTTNDKRVFNQDTKRILYKHIPNLTYFTSTSFDLIKMDIKVSGQNIAYINGAGDDVPDILKNLGYQVSFLENGDIKKDKFKEFKTVIIGIRAFNTNQALASNVDQLMGYIKEGGNVIVQYNTSSPLLTREMGPFPFSLSRDRVTVEGSPVVVDFNHPIMSFPNKIEASDFDGWVQERGLYFTSNWDSNYSTPFTMQDPGEKASQGALLFAKYGKGTYTYSGISWFRQLPAGVPGAIKIFVNLIEQPSGK